MLITAWALENAVALICGTGTCPRYEKLNRGGPIPSEASEGKELTMPVATEHRTFATGVNFTERVRHEVTDLLNARLADAIDLKTQAKQAHWNVKGMQFMFLHELFDSVATHLDDQADMLAERITALG